MLTAVVASSLDARVGQTDSGGGERTKAAAATGRRACMVVSGHERDEEGAHEAWHELASPPSRRACLFIPCLFVFVVCSEEIESADEVTQGLMKRLSLVKGS